MFKRLLSTCEKTKRIFSGIQPTGAIHLGNYMGAILQWIQMQNEHKDVILSIVDLHSITLPQDPKQLSRNILDMTASLLACGIDYEKVILFRQSTVPQHTELYWYLGCISTMPRLGHLPQFKEKSAKLKDVPLGLFTYPVLQAADILLYKATHVPVGEDQLQHLQLTQELARMFNNRFGYTFSTPHAIITDERAARVRSLREPSKKMSKSDLDSKSCIYLTDSSDEIRSKIKKAVTDCVSQVTYDPVNRAGISNLITIHSVLSGKTIKEVVKQAEGLDTGKYKIICAEAVVEYMKPIRKKFMEYSNDVEFLLHNLESGAEKASKIAETTIKEVRNKIGLEYSSRDAVRVCKKSSN